MRMNWIYERHSEQSDEGAIRRSAIKHSDESLRRDYYRDCHYLIQLWLQEENCIKCKRTLIARSQTKQNETFLFLPS